MTRKGQPGGWQGIWPERGWHARRWEAKKRGAKKDGGEGKPKKDSDEGAPKPDAEVAKQKLPQALKLKSLISKVRASAAGLLHVIKWGDKNYRYLNHQSAYGDLQAALPRLEDATTPFDEQFLVRGAKDLKNMFSARGVASCCRRAPAAREAHGVHPR